MLYIQCNYVRKQCENGHLVWITAQIWQNCKENIEQGVSKGNKRINILRICIS